MLYLSPDGGQYIEYMTEGHIAPEYRASTLIIGGLDQKDVDLDHYPLH